MRNDWKEGTVQDFLGLSDVDVALVETKLDCFQTSSARLARAESPIGNSVGRNPTLRGTPIFKPCRGVSTRAESPTGNSVGRSPTLRGTHTIQALKGRNQQG